MDPATAPAGTVDELDELIDELSKDPQHHASMQDADEFFRLLATLRGIRKTQGIKQKEVARRMGTTQSAVSKIEGGASDPQLMTLMRYARAINARIAMRPCIDRPRDQSNAEEWVRRSGATSTTRPAVRPMRTTGPGYLRPVNAA